MKLRKLAALMLILVLLTPAAAMGEEKGLKISWMGNTSLEEGQSALALKTLINHAQSGEITYALTDTASKKTVYTEKRTAAAGDEITWPVVYSAEGLSASKPAKRMRAVFSLDGKNYSYDFFYAYGKENGKVVLTAERAVWYPNNTACSFGPQFREVRPELTDKWYMFTPLDLSLQGRQEFEYAAGNMYIIGKVYVDVQGDLVKVTYENFYEEKGGNTETVEEFLTFFPDLASVTNVDPESMEDQGFSFGKPISIARDLNGDTRVLLFIRNRVNYRDYATNTHKLVRFWINHPDRVAMRNSMMAIMD